MVTVNTESLAETLDSINDALFYERILTESECRAVARWIAEMRDEPGSYAGMFALMSSDRSNGSEYLLERRSGLVRGSVTS